MLVMPTEPSELPEGFAVQSDAPPNDPLTVGDTTLVATSAASCCEYQPQQYMQHAATLTSLACCLFMCISLRLM